MNLEKLIELIAEQAAREVVNTSRHLPVAVWIAVTWILQSRNPLAPLTLNRS
ncbi:MAG: hypothetical protein V2I43_10465 [Parvularcula sp.]|nr:hypothetical protein [Parvularcula sp.]